MSFELGVTTIGRLERPSIIAGDFPRVTAEVTAGTSDIAFGSIVTIDGDGTAVLIDDIPAVDDDPPVTPFVYGVAAEDIAAGSVGVVWLTGEFVGPRLVIGSTDPSASWENYKARARIVSIFFKDASLASNH